MANYDAQFEARQGSILPSQMAFSGTAISIPRYSVWNFREREAVLDIDVANLTFPSDNFYLGTRYSVSPNTLGTTATRNFGAGNASCTLNTGTESAITACRNCTMNGTYGLLMAASQGSSFVTNNTTNSPTTDHYNSAILCCSNCTVTSGTLGARHNTLIGCNSSSVIHANDDFEIVGNTMTSSHSCGIRQGRGNGVHSCFQCFIASGAPLGTPNSLRSTIISSLNAAVQYDCNYSSIVASNNGRVRSGDYCLLSGNNPDVVSYDNVLAFGATATSSNQAIFGTRMDVTGGNLTVSAGSVHSARAYIKGVREASTNTTLLSTDAHLRNTTSATTLTIPTAASMSASFPLNSVVEFDITAAHPNSLTIVTSGGENFRGKDRFNTISLKRCAPFKLYLVNRSVTPFWDIGGDIVDTVTATAPTNNFGITPPKSDAAQLPTTTSQANHLTLNPTGWVTMTTIDNTAYASLASGNLVFPIPGVYQFEYSFQILTSTGVGEYLIRADLVNTNSSVTLDNSYVQVGGTNTIGGTRTVRGSTSVIIRNLVDWAVTIRISQDSANLINASANIQNIWLQAKLQI